MQADTPTPATLTDVVAELRLLRDSLATPPSEMIDRVQFAGLVGIGASTLDRLRETEAVGPKPVRLGGLRWHRAEVTAWLAHRDQAGELHDQKTWPAVWASLQRKAGITGR